MATVFDPKSGLYVCIRDHGIVGYGDTPKSAESRADAIERERAKRIQAELERIQKDRIVIKYRFNTVTQRYEAIAE